MANFIDSDVLVSPIFPKDHINIVRPGLESYYVDGPDWNTLVQSVKDIRNHLYGASGGGGSIQGRFYGLLQGAASPAPTGVVNYLWLDNTQKLKLRLADTTDAVVKLGDTSLPAAYTAGGAGPQVIAMSGASGAVLLRDGTSPLAGTLFGIQSNNGSVKYLDITDNNTQLFTSSVPNSGTNVAHRFDTTVALAGTTLLMDFRVNGATVASIPSVGTPAAAEHLTRAQDVGFGQLVWGARAATAADTTAYYTSPYYGDAAPTTTEYKIKMVRAGLLRYLYVTATTAPSTQGVNFTVRKNGVDTSITCLMAAAGNSASDISHTVTFAAGDEISLKQQGVTGITGAAAGIMASLGYTLF